MDVVQALLTGVYGFLILLGFAGAGTVALLIAGAIGAIIKRAGGEEYDSHDTFDKTAK